VSFSLAIYRLADREFIRDPPAVGSPDFEQWEAECDEQLLFEAPVGSDGAIRSYWSAPAAALELRLLNGLYDNGLEVAGEDLATLRSEVESLQRHWIETVDDDAVITYQIEGREIAVPMLVDLVGRAEDVLADIRIAQRLVGFVTIG
jgi:hypothetical protein